MTAHAIHRTEDDTRLLHDCHGCREGQYVQDYGFDEFETWKPGTYPVEHFAFFDGDGEYSCGLQLTYEDVPDDDYAPATPDDGRRVLGFPYEGRSWGT